jgi:co-chaperonin GroES (HSP10)
MELKMFGDRIVFTPIHEEEEDIREVKTESGLFIPQQAAEQERQQRRNYKGKALFVGGECKFVKEGTIVAYDQYGVADFWHEGKKLMICREKDLIGKYE